MRISIPHIIMIAMILAFHTNTLGSPVPDPEGDIVVQVKQQAQMPSQRCGPEQGCLGVPADPEPETEPELAATTPPLNEVRVLVKPIPGKTPKMNYHKAVQHCTDMPGGEPFMPKTPEDIEIIMNFADSLGEDGLWMPVNDLSTEGQLQWWNGDDAMTDGQAFPWLLNGFMGIPGEGELATGKMAEEMAREYDCVVVDTVEGVRSMWMTDCLSNAPATVDEMWVPYPMICEMKMNISDEQQMFLEKMISLGRVETI